MAVATDARIEKLIPKGAWKAPQKELREVKATSFEYYNSYITGKNTYPGNINISDSTVTLKDNTRGNWVLPSTINPWSSPPPFAATPRYEKEVETTGFPLEEKFREFEKAQKGLGAFGPNATGVHFPKSVVMTREKVEELLGAMYEWAMSAGLEDAQVDDCLRIFLKMLGSVLE